ncbi:MAG TPA: DNAase [Gammaproteobacteria bacterium]|jgi:TatD DNase family protein|nr:DNAase [Gammaproteobacteria bacterium]|tara:strand:- start:2551 stop:3327 length:777 start_codon:yes stop_codon:yes gene_type:complete
MLVDSHCHVDFPEFGEDLSGVLDRAFSADVGHLLCVCVNLADFHRVLAIANRSKHISASVGVHPNTQLEPNDEPLQEQLEILASDRKVVAIGETGLDFYRDDCDPRTQKERFSRHIGAARQTKKPLIIHTRNAAKETLELMQAEQASKAGGVMHCFAEDWATAKGALDLGFYISFSGIVTFKNAQDLREVAQKVPLDRLLVETDAPYLAPVPFRGKRNEPAFVKHTAECLADLRGLELSELAALTTENFFRLFNRAEK